MKSDRNRMKEDGRIDKARIRMDRGVMGDGMKY